VLLYCIIAPAICNSQVAVGVLSLSLNFLRDCRLEREEYRTSALAINYTSLALVFVISTLNVIISALDPGPA